MFFDEIIHCRLDRQTKKKLEEIHNQDTLKYENVSHIIRCAIIKLHREEVKK